MPKEIKKLLFLLIITLTIHVAVIIIAILFAAKIFNPWWVWIIISIPNLMLMHRSLKKYLKKMIETTKALEKRPFVHDEHIKFSKSSSEQKNKGGWLSD